MELSNDTVNVLKNFSLINPSVELKQGTKLSTVSAQKSIMAVATLDDSFPSGGAIYDLNRFLGVLGLFEKPQLTFDSHHVKVNGNAQTVNYRFADPEMIITPPKDSIDLPDPDVDITVTQRQIQNVLRAASVMQLPEVAICGDENISLSALNSSDRGSDTYDEVIEDNKTGHKFRFIFKVENIKIMNYDYNVRITSRGISQFTSLNADGPSLVYWIAVEQNSDFK
tara:strand:+ start:2551 stop:3225 length:675 start_codon:yes stop_codon:yes gene_type:complete